MALVYMFNTHEFIYLILIDPRVGELNPLQLNEKIIIISFAFSTLIGIVFGCFPARKIIRMNPNVALRY